MARTIAEIKKKLRMKKTCPFHYEAFSYPIQHSQPKDFGLFMRKLSLGE